MEFYDPPPSTADKCCCDCGCNSCSSLDRSRSGMVLRSVKRKYDEFEEENKLISGHGVPKNARVEIENECVALRETVVIQQETIQDLICELEEERNASSSAANETMSMILRLQREKAEIEMEAKQFKRFTEERITHDQQEISELEELLYKREHTIEALTCEIHAYKHRLMSYGLTEAEAEAEVGELCRRNEEKIRNPDNSMLPGYEIYPPLKCKVNNSHLYLDDYEKADDVDKHSFGGTPRSRTELKDLDRRINPLEKPARTIQPDGECKKEIVGQSPRKTSHLRRSSNDSTTSPTLKERGTDCVSVSPKHKKTGYSHLDVSPKLKKATNAPEAGEYIINKVYTVDSTHQRATNGIMNSKTSAVVGGEDVEIQKLYARLHALETDRETMRQAIASMGSDKAHLVMLKEIAQNLVKEMAPSRAKPVQEERSIVKSLYVGSMYKWVASTLLWRRKAQRSKFSFGLSANNAGLLLLIDRNHRVGSRKILYSANFRHL